LDIRDLLLVHGLKGQEFVVLLKKVSLSGVFSGTLLTSEGVAKRELLRTPEKLILLKQDLFQLAIPSDARKVPPKILVKLTSLKEIQSQPATLLDARKELLPIMATLPHQVSSKNLPYQPATPSDAKRVPLPTMVMLRHHLSLNLSQLATHWAARREPPKTPERPTFFNSITNSWPFKP